MSVSIVCMVNHTAISSLSKDFNSTNLTNYNSDSPKYKDEFECPKKNATEKGSDGEFEWSKQIQVNTII